MLYNNSAGDDTDGDGVTYGNGTRALTGSMTMTRRSGLLGWCCSSSGGTTCGTCGSYGVTLTRWSGCCCFWERVAEVGACYVRLSGTGLIEIGMLIANAVVNDTN